MASSTSRPERGFHQDYIARIRYSNALPPPPNPPKLLDIPNTGLASGHYTSAGFASRLVREQPLNIEADAELGMPIDLVGIPGIFEGDESAIHPAADPAPLHPADRALLRPLASLGKPNTNISTVSFLRRTEYITSVSLQTNKTASSDALRTTKSPVPRPRKRRIDENKENPLQIAKGIVKGFDLAYPADAYTGTDDGRNIKGADITSAEKDAWKRPQHPIKGDSVKLLDAYPLLPDWDALPPGNAEVEIPPAYSTFKFTTNPVGAKDKYEEKVDVALLQQRSISEEEEAKVREAEEAYARDSISNARYIPMADYVFFLPDETVSVSGVKRKFDVLDPERDTGALYGMEDDDEEKTAFRYNNVRVYETYRQSGDPESTFAEVALVLHDRDSGANANSREGRKAAYFYPIMQRAMIRQKGKKFDMIRGVAADAYNPEDDATRVDAIDVRVRDFSALERDDMIAEQRAFEPVD